MKVTIGIPVYGGFQPQTVQSLLDLVAHGGYDFHFVVAENGYTIAENRNYIAIQALNNKSEYLLMVDADMTFKADLLDKMVSNGKDICGVAYHPRCESDRLKALDETHWINLDKSSDPKYKQVFECHATGTGIILIKCDIFYKIPRPWFQFEWHETGQCKEGEDWFFCKQAKEAGYKIWADPNVYVGHLGDKIV